MTTSLEQSRTSSPLDVRIGSQRPRVRVVPEGDDHLGREVVDFMAEVGRPLDEWQAEATIAAFTLRPDNLWAAFEFALLLSRQNGKGGLTEAIELGSMFLFHEPLILHSAHESKTATTAFQRLVDIIDGSDWLRRRIKGRPRTQNGAESIKLLKWAGGSEIKFVSRTKGSGRGFTGSKNIFDEAAWLTVSQYAAQTPTLATLPNPQIIYTSTPPDDDVGPLPADAMLPSVRRRGLAGSPRVALMEWSPAPGFDRGNPDTWYETNPALGIRISEWFLAKQLDAFTEVGKPWKFDTEHLGLWPDDVAHQWQVLAEQEWSAASRPRAAMADPVTFGVWVSPDRSRTAIAAAGNREDRSGSRLIEVTGTPSGLDYRPGTGWAVPRLEELVPKHRPLVVVTNDKALADTADPRLLVHFAGPSDQAAASGTLYDGIRNESARHLGQVELTNSVAAATKRTTGTAWVWDQTGPIDVCPVGAASLALWGLLTPRVHQRKSGGVPSFAHV